ncbi:hypothetical protein WICANDRAFT_13339, partial [Wickerhamomyces anomalus NRRL Y-366-8]
MRQKRAKQYRKQMLVYKHTFKFREPYQVIVDEQIVQVCEQSSYDLKKGLERTIQAEVRPMITQCCMEELYKTKNQKLIEYGKSFERRRCNHPPAKPVPSHECIKSIVIVDGENKHRYVVASENEQLRWSLRKIPGIPLIYMNRAVMVMEPLSKASAQASRTLERGKLSKGLNDVKVGFKNPVMDEDEKEVAEKVVKKRKGPKEPNPLSIKKKKT